MNTSTIIQVIKEHITEYTNEIKIRSNSGDVADLNQKINALERVLADIRKPEEEETEETVVSDPCPECGKQLVAMPRSGVKCSCGYWFCF